MLDNHTVELGTQGKDLFCRLLEEAGKKIFARSPRVRYKPSSHPCGENTLATSLCTWSPNELAYTALVSSRPFSGADAGDLASSFIAASSSSLVQTPKLGEVAPL